MHPGDLAEQVLVRLDPDRLQPGTAADQLAVIPPAPFEQHVDGLADLGAVEGLAMVLQHSVEPREALGLDRFGDLILVSGGGRAGATRLFEGKGAGVAHGFAKLQRRLEIRLGFAGEADYEVA